MTSVRHTLYVRNEYQRFLWDITGGWKVKKNVLWPTSSYRAVYLVSSPKLILYCKIWCVCILHRFYRKLLFQKQLFIVCTFSLLFLTLLTAARSVWCRMSKHVFVQLHSLRISNRGCRKKHKRMPILLVWKHLSRLWNKFICKYVIVVWR